MATLKPNLKGELTLSEAMEYLLDKICIEMESTLMLNSEYNPVLDINTLFQDKQMSIWNRESSKDMGVKERTLQLSIYHVI